MLSKYLAVVFPGIGYNTDKPLLYYAAKLALNKGYDIFNIQYHDMPQKIRGNAEMMRISADIAYEQVKEQLCSTDLNKYDKILFIAKSLGTVVSSRYASEHGSDAGQIWYTPVEATFSSATLENRKIVAFIGDEDPWSDVDAVKNMAKERDIPLFSYPECNHSLESGDVDRNIEILREVMVETKKFMDHY
ncbi:MAG: alpha/beta hydrolase [Oscillospiraceae bacterium]|nr:alpha/beta hydrolase [Oscillospiraceae bacterium]